MMIANFLKILILMCCLSWLFISMSEKFFYSMKLNETNHPRPTVSSKIIDLIKHELVFDIKFVLECTNLNLF